MKAIILECETAGFKYGATAPVGSGKGEIPAKQAKDLVDSGFAKEVKEVVVDSSAKGKELAAKDVALSQRESALAAKEAELADREAGIAAAEEELAKALAAAKKPVKG